MALSKAPSGEELPTASIAKETVSENGTTAKLEALTREMGEFYVGFEKDVEHRRGEESNRIKRLEEQIQAVDNSCKSEARKRAEADRQLQIVFENQLKDFQTKLDNHFTALMTPIQKSLAELNSRLDKMEKDLDAKNEKILKDVLDLSENTTRRVDVIEGSIEREKSARMDSLSQLSKSINDVMFKSDDNFAAEKMARETMLTRLRDDIAQDRSARDKASEKFAAYVRDQFATVKKDLDAEKSARENEDKSIGNAFESFSKTVRQGLVKIA